jgi:NADH-quinone oxidoreductase subunit J
MEAILFPIVAVVAVIAALVVFAHRNPVIGALFLVANLMCVAILFLLLSAPFLAAIQVIVYAGAIMVLIVFVIMLLNLPREKQGVESGGSVQKILGALAVSAFVLLVGRATLILPSGVRDIARTFGTAEFVGRRLFGDFFYPFEAVSLILLVAMAGAVVLAKKRL